MNKADWQPPETAPKDGTIFEITTAGPQVDLCRWDAECRYGKEPSFRDYYHKQRIEPIWPYMVAWRCVRPPAVVGMTEAESRLANGFSTSEDSSHVV